MWTFLLRIQLDSGIHLYMTSRTLRGPLVSVDIDGTVADTVLHIIQFLERRFNLDTKPADYPNFDFSKIPFLEDNPAIQAELRMRLRDPRFYADIPVVAGAEKAIAALIDAYTVKFISSRPQPTWQMTGMWLAKHFPRALALLDPQEQFAYYTERKAAYIHKLRPVAVIEDNPDRVHEIANRRIPVFKVGNRYQRSLPRQTNFRYVHEVKDVYEAAQRLLKYKGINLPDLVEARQVAGHKEI